MLYKGINPKQAIPVISATQAFRMPKKGCSTYVCAINAAETQESDPREILVVQEFLRVFQEVPGLTPDRKIEFMIKLVPGIASISKAPYRMACAKLAELKT